MADKKKQPNTYGIRKRIAGKTVKPAGRREGRNGKMKMSRARHGGPKSHEAAKHQSVVTYESGQKDTKSDKPAQYVTDAIPGQFRVSMPEGRMRFIDQPGWRHRGEPSRIAVC